MNHGGEQEGATLYIGLLHDCRAYRVQDAMEKQPDAVMMFADDQAISTPSHAMGSDKLNCHTLNNTHQ